MTLTIDYPDRALNRLSTLLRSFWIMVQFAATSDGSSPRVRTGRLARRFLTHRLMRTAGRSRHHDKQRGARPRANTQEMEPCTNIRSRRDRHNQ